MPPKGYRKHRPTDETCTEGFAEKIAAAWNPEPALGGAIIALGDPRVGVYLPATDAIETHISPTTAETGVEDTSLSRFRAALTSTPARRLFDEMQAEITTLRAQLAEKEAGLHSYAVTMQRIEEAENATIAAQAKRIAELEAAQATLLAAAKRLAARSPDIAKPEFRGPYTKDRDALIAALAEYQALASPCAGIRRVE
jgi:hypothetical protein